MPRKNRVIAILVSDIHLSMTRPPCYNPDLDWYEVMKRKLYHLEDLSQRYGKAAIICAGDVFDKWNSNPELINFAIKTLPRMYSIPGQHDLPTHAESEIHRSAYQTLIETGNLTEISHKHPVYFGNGIYLHGFPWNSEIKMGDHETADLHIAVIHKYIWMKGKTYPGAPEDNRVGAFEDQLKDFDVAIFGDNHKGFLARSGDCKIVNNGGFMIRKTDEIGTIPKVGLLHEDGTIERVPLDYDFDSNPDNFQNQNIEFSDSSWDMNDFIKELGKLGEESMDFRENIYQYLEENEVPEFTKIKLLESIGE